MSNPLWTTAFQATTFSVLLVGAVIYGAIVQQIARYVFVFRHDHTTLKLWVYSLGILTTAGFGVDCACTWGYLTGDLSAASSPMIALDGFLVGTTVALVQAFFAVRIWNVRKEVRPSSAFTVPFAVLLGVCISASFGANAAANAFITGAIPAPENGLIITTDLLRFKIVIDGVIDGLVTMSLVTLLRTHRNEFAHLKKESPLTMLLVFFAARGLIILTSQMAFFILIFASEPLTVGTANTMIMSKIYAVSMLLTLTNRKTNRSTQGSGSSASRGQRTRASEHVDLVALSFRTNARPVDPERDPAADGRASPVVFHNSKGPPEEVTMEPDPDDWDNSIGDHRRTGSSKVSLPSEHGL